MTNALKADRDDLYGKLFAAIRLASIYIEDGALRTGANKLSKAADIASRLADLKDKELEELING